MPSSPVLVLTGCSAKKSTHDSRRKIPAEKLYQGQLFRMVKQYAELQGFDWAIISAKYGLVFPQENITSYDQRIQTREDVERLQEQVLPKLGEILDQYEKIIVVMGTRYVDVIQPLIDERHEMFEIHKGEGGLGGYLHEMAGHLKVLKVKSRQKNLDALMKSTPEPPDSNSST